jgi:hypothetical protein
VVEARAVDRDLTAGDTARHQDGPRFDAVPHHLVLDRCQALDPVDLDRRRPRARDLRAHAVEECRQVADLRLAGGVVEHRLTLRQHGRREQVLGGADTREVEHDAGAAQRLTPRLDETVHDLEVGAHGLQAAEVHVELAAADVVAAGHRDSRLAAARQQRSQHVDRGAHPRDELVRRLRSERPRGVDRELVLARPRGAGADGAHHVQHRVEVEHRMQVAEHRHAGRQQRRRHLLEPGVLGRAAHAHGAGQRTVGPDDERVHHSR